MFGFLKQHLEQKAAREAQAAIDARARQIAPGKAPARSAGPQSPSPSDSAAPAPFDRDSAIARMQSQLKDRPSDQRKALIAQAMAVHRAKQKILADLDDESRAKLVAMAITSLLAQTEPPKK